MFIVFFTLQFDHTFLKSRIYIIIYYVYINMYKYTHVTYIYQPLCSWLPVLFSWSCLLKSSGTLRWCEQHLSPRHLKPKLQVQVDPNKPVPQERSNFSRFLFGFPIWGTEQYALYTCFQKIFKSFDLNSKNPTNNPCCPPTSASRKRFLWGENHGNCESREA